MLTLKQQIAIEPDVLVQELSGELVLLNLATEEYFGLDDVGNAMWSALKESDSLQVAYDRLLEHYDVAPERLKQDFLNLIEQFIEPDDAIIVAKQVAIDNGCADKIEFIQGISTQIDLPERANVMISDLRGALPLFQHHIPSISDARHRLLAPHGIQIPHQDTIWVTLISDPEYYQKKYQSPWEEAHYGCILSANRPFVTNNW